MGNRSLWLDWIFRLGLACMDHSDEPTSSIPGFVVEGINPEASKVACDGSEIVLLSHGSPRSVHSGTHVKRLQKRFWRLSYHITRC